MTEKSDFEKRGFFSRENTLILHENQNKHCDLTEELTYQNLNFSRENHVVIYKNQKILCELTEKMGFSKCKRFFRENPAVICKT